MTDWDDVDTMDTELTLEEEDAAAVDVRITISIKDGVHPAELDWESLAERAAEACYRRVAELAEAAFDDASELMESTCDCDDCMAKRSARTDPKDMN